MKDDPTMREQLSALADGGIGEAEWSETFAYAQTAEGQEAWAVYHLIGDVLRSPELARPGNAELADRVMAQLAREERPAAEVALPDAVPLAPAVQAQGEAANAAVFRWKMVAGLASLAAVGVLGWSGLSGGLPAGGETRLAAAPSRLEAPATTTLVSATDPAGEPQVMLRDPRLDELLAAHRQYGGASALQMPAGFLRNATFETPQR
ncbi:Anti sigma-E protein RseA family protein [Paracidovorax avenae ATCC 19860]|uniref:Anti sigma-E protein RseA family protein n=1 Tax=Paracidovorax avenae (strain ATCC 19860 / DSM 7227 / CCUG 15838 / JCM 20985 / LMG 2117 / NCPPB 1011) TaxID=643561 RepID=F0QCY3_PARA1|nr:sigma-E factor negative regulatory protein [Paracidovorax avenae]ADX45126.1 Anti sigma-E protein RseA family protein [Paracidovorax avenae ATCC 19860]AVS64303.1 anti-sigma factor [Paracidovorax avenae]